MARIATQLTELHTERLADCTTNPEFILMTAEDDSAVCDEIEAYWLAGLAVTKPKQHDY